MPADGSRNERDLILAPNEYAFILDETKGNIVNYVGPHKTSLANTDQPVIFNRKTKRFERCKLEAAVQNFAIAPEGWYIVLKNPPSDGKMPRIGTANSLPDLDIGRKVNIPGPVSFAPWPGQMVRVLQGHHLRSNQYLLVRVYDEEGAKANWGKAVIKPQTAAAETPAESAPVQEIPDLTMGKQLIIKGTDVSFYIPPTGIEVVINEDGEYVRNAVTLERLEYCILLDEDGNKRFITGPAVVFPHPTENFVSKAGVSKFKAIELNEISGLYVKVTAPYQEDGKSYKVGDELFITGKDQMIYFPRPEHAIISYGEQEVHYAVAIPAGEARYVLDRLSGQISLKRGPTILLPDPRKEVIVRRVLDPKQVAIWFPGNQEAFEYNRRLMEIAREKKGEEFIREQPAQLEAAQVARSAAPAPEFAGDKFTRKQGFTAPRTITLDTKYEGAVSVNAWTGYAVLVVSKTGERKVIVGPGSYLLEYDEILETVELSTGTPKSDTNLMKTVYLRVLHNKVSDIVQVETRDLCPVEILLSYRVNFEGDPKQWFNVENYVKFLTDHLRSILRNTSKQYSIESFYANAISIIRDTILGVSGEDSKRTGRLFSENGMRIYDVEILNVAILDDTIGELLTEAQHTTVQETLELEAQKRNQAITEQKEAIKQKIAQTASATEQLMLNLEIVTALKQSELNLVRLESETEVERKKLEARLSEQESLNKIDAAELSREKAQYDLKLGVTQQQLNQRLEEIKAEVEAVVNKAGAVSPRLIAALQSFADKALAERMAESMSPLAILGGKSVADVLGQLLKGTVVERALARFEEDE
ncbi:MAG: hypothetical protein BWK80_31325 [Desulfobacteraceae bacterium IS3]|nr:MAG: hypothetical protein BWK80_31325 [Desulfobacteraceae bacterium IS3]